MSKIQHNVKLTGYLEDGSIAKTHQASDVIFFQNYKKEFNIINVDQNELLLITTSDQYKLIKHESLNIYQGVCNNIKVHVSLKKIVGKLIYWS